MSHMDKSERIYLSPPHMGTEERRQVTEAFDSNWIAPIGPHLNQFEKMVCDYLDVPAAVGVSSGTAALHLALRLLNVGRGDSVFCASLTFIGSANPILYQGAEPVFIDSDLETWNMSPQALARAMSDAARSKRLPKAVIVVNLYGQCADLDAIQAICSEYDVPLIEDAAESLGSTYKGKKSGVFGRLGILSFNGNKIITTSSGGMIVSHDVAAIEKMRYWSTQARDPAMHYQHSEMGYNYRLSNVLAAIGCGQMTVLDERVRARRAVFDRYHVELSGVAGIEFMPEASFGKSNRWLTTLTVDPSLCGVTSGHIIEKLAGANIEARPVWKPLHIQPLFAGTQYYPHEEGQSQSEFLFERGLCLPSGSGLTDQQQKKVINLIKNTLST